MQCLKPVTYKNNKYLDWMRGRNCQACDYLSGTSKIGEPHHVRRPYWGAGVSKKSHDYTTISLCRPHHEKCQDTEKSVPYERFIIENLMRYIEFKRSDYFTKSIKRPK